MNNREKQLLKRMVISGGVLLVVLLIVILAIVIRSNQIKKENAQNISTEANAENQTESATGTEANGMSGAENTTNAENEDTASQDSNMKETNANELNTDESNTDESNTDEADASKTDNQEQNQEDINLEETLHIVQQPSMYTYDQMEQDLQQMAKAYPDFVTLDSLGTTLDGRELYHLILGDPGASRQVMINAAIHGREYITTQVLMQQTYEFLKKYKENGASILSDTAIHVIPMVNPDGVTISQLGLDGLKTEEAKASVESVTALDQPENITEYYRRWKSNAQGIDINRTFDAKWEEYDDQVHHPSSDHYKGETIGSTVESQALIMLTDQYAFAKTISYHTQGNVVYWYFAQSGDLYDQTLAFANEVGSLTGYSLDANYENLDPAGYKDWAISKKGIPSLTIEIGSTYSPVDPAQYNQIWQENKDVWNALLQ